MENDSATLPRPAKIFFPKKAKEDHAKSEELVLDMGEASRLEGFRQYGGR